MASVRNGFERREKKFVFGIEHYTYLPVCPPPFLEKNARERSEAGAEFGLVSFSTRFERFSRRKARRPQPNGNAFSGRFRVRRRERCWPPPPPPPPFRPVGLPLAGRPAASTVSQGSRRERHVAYPAAYVASRVCSRRRRHVPRRVRRIFRNSECAGPVVCVSFRRFAAVRSVSTRGVWPATGTCANEIGKFGVFLLPRTPPWDSLAGRTRQRTLGSSVGTRPSSGARYLWNAGHP